MLEALTITASVVWSLTSIMFGIWLFLIMAILLYVLIMD